MTSGSRCIHYVIKRALSKPIIKQPSTNLSLLFLSLESANSTGPVACSDSHHLQPQLNLYSPPSKSHESRDQLAWLWANLQLQGCSDIGHTTLLMVLT